MRNLATALASVGLALVCPTSSARPVIVELYTSEGCSSCPPAEQLLEELSKRSDVLPLAFHVDYWNSLGWTDRFSLQEATQRQEAAGRTLGLTTVGTPHFIVEGRTSVWGASAVGLQKALRAPATDIPIRATKNSSSLVIQVERPQRQPPFDVYVIGYLGRATSPIARGENAGRTLTEINIVRYLRRIGRSSDATSQWTVPIAELPKDADHIAVLLQQPHDGTVVGALSRAL